MSFPIVQVFAKHVPTMTICSTHANIIHEVLFYE